MGVNVLPDINIVFRHFFKMNYRELGLVFFPEVAFHS